MLLLLTRVSNIKDFTRFPFIPERKKRKLSIVEIFGAIGSYIPEFESQMIRLLASFGMFFICKIGILKHFHKNKEMCHVYYLFYMYVKILYIYINVFLCNVMHIYIFIYINVLI